MIEAKTGRKVQHVKIAELGERLQEFRGDTKSADHDMGIQSACRLFRDFMATRHPSAVHLYETTPGDADAFYKALRATKAPRTAHGYTATLKAAFARFMPPGAANPFAEVKLSGAGDSVHRRPFTAVQFRALIDAAAGDPMMRDLITAGACTGMRRGDLCKLAWESIDLTGGMVIAKASKTGEPVEVPLFEPLREVLAARAGNGSEFCFPEAEAMLAANPQGLSYRFKRIVAAALDTAADPATDTTDTDPTDTEPAPDTTEPDTTEPAEMEGEGLAAIIANVAAGPRRDRMVEAFRLYATGRTFREIEAKTGTPRGVISADFRAVEGWTGKRFVRSTRGPDMKSKVAALTRTRRTKGARAASIYDFHALRTTWVTLALSAGVPMELVRRVTGHATVDVVLRHYFRPGRDEFKAALVGALPSVLTGAKAPLALPPADELAALAAKAQAGTATDADRSRMRELVADM